MFTDKIKDATLEYHQQVEKVLIGKLKGMRSKEDYIDLLHLFFGYFGGLEQKIKQYINGVELPDYNERRKTDALINDLEALASTTPAVADGNDLPLINNKLQAFGALYVIEGSTLGGKIISRMIKQHLSITDEAALSFFNGYGEQTQQMWDTFKEALNDAVKNEEDEIAVLNSANETFRKFKQWLEK